MRSHARLGGRRNGHSEIGSGLGVRRDFHSRLHSGLGARLGSHSTIHSGLNARLDLCPGAHRVCAAGDAAARQQAAAHLFEDDAGGKLDTFTLFVASSGDTTITSRDFPMRSTIARFPSICIRTSPSCSGSQQAGTPAPATKVPSSHSV